MATYSNVKKIKVGNDIFQLYDSGGTVTGIKMNGISYSPSSGVVDLGTVITAHQDISGKIDTAGTGLSKSGTTLNHSNSITAQTTQALYPIKIDAQGHISGYGSAVTIGAAAAKGVTDNSSNADVTSSDTNLITARTLYYQLAKKGYTTNTGTVTSIGLTNATNGGLTISDSPITTSGNITVGHSNVLTNAQTTSGVYPIKIDKNGHISEYGSAVSIPSMSATTASITTTGWSNNSLTVNVSGVTASNTVVVTPAPTSMDEYIACKIKCTAQSSGTLTFECETEPENELTANVLIYG